MLTKYALVAIIVLCITVLGFTLLVHSSLCKLSIKERNVISKPLAMNRRRSSIRAGQPRVWVVRTHPLAPIFLFS